MFSRSLSASVFSEIRRPEIMRKMIGSFPAFDEAGNKKTVCVSKQIITTLHFEGEGELKGVTYLTIGTIDGELINRISQGVYVTRLTKLKLKSSHPKAV